MKALGQAPGESVESVVSLALCSAIVCKMLCERGWASVEQCTVSLEQVHGDFGEARILFAFVILTNESNEGFAATVGETWTDCRCPQLPWARSATRCRLSMRCVRIPRP